MCHAKKRKKINFFSPSDLHTIVITENLVKQWRRTYPNPSSLLPLLSSVKLKKKFSERSKLCSIAYYYSCQKGSVFGSQMSLTKSWLQAACKARSKSHQGKQIRVWVEGPSFTRTLGEAMWTGGEKKTQINKFLN